MTLSLLITVFLASLVGSLHCAGMCGGLVALCISGREVHNTRSIQQWQPYAAYNLGRLCTYASLGAVSGAIGAAIDLGGSALGISRIAVMVAGGTMIGIALIALLRVGGIRFGNRKLPALFTKPIQRGLGMAHHCPPVRRSLIIGLLTGFLPCGWLYAFVIASAGTGHAAYGALTMIAFWLGTVPVMLGLGLGVQTCAGRLRNHVPTLSAVALLLVGCIAITGRLLVPAYADSIDSQMSASTHSSQEATTEINVQRISEIALPCCESESTERLANIAQSE